jgi:hypothetical protein
MARINQSTPNMNIDNLISRLQKFEPVLLQANGNTPARIMEKSARAVCGIPTNDEADEDKIAADLENVLAEAWNSESQTFTRLSVHLPQEALGVTDLDRTLANLATFLGDQSTTQIRVYLDQAYNDWPAIRALTKSLRERADAKKTAGVRLLVVAPFTSIPQAEMEALFESGVRIRFAAGWAKDCPSDRTPVIDTDALQSFSKFGFRAAIEWYVHVNNMEAFEEQIPDLLVQNHFSGFSMPLVSENPYWAPGTGCPSLPDALDYCQLLARIYKQYPYYDDVFSPLTGLALLVKGGGWHSQMGIPVTADFLVDANGGIGLYRQTPALAQPWNTVSNVAAASADDLRTVFLEFAKNAWNWEKLGYCHGCRWRHVCGGIDMPKNQCLLEKDLDVMCGHLKLFLEHFASLRATDWVAGETKQKG